MINFPVLSMEPISPCMKWWKVALTMPHVLWVLFRLAARPLEW